MSNVLIVAEQSGGHLKKATLHAIAAGQAIAGRTGGKVHVALLGKGVGAIATELSSYGVTVHAADSAGLEHYLAEAFAPVVAEIARGAGATFVGAAATAFGKDLVPRVAARMGAATATEVLGFGGAGPAVTFQRPMWAGNVLAEVDLASRKVRRTVPLGALGTGLFAPAGGKPLVALAGEEAVFVDPANGALLVGDVGESAWEEIDRAAGGGRNFGWPLREGPAPFSITCANPPIFAIARVWARS